MKHIRHSGSAYYTDSHSTSDDGDGTWAITRKRGRHGDDDQLTHDQIRIKTETSADYRQGFPWRFFLTHGQGLFPTVALGIHAFWRHWYIRVPDPFAFPPSLAVKCVCRGRAQGSAR